MPNTKQFHWTVKDKNKIVWQGTAGSQLEAWIRAVGWDNFKNRDTLGYTIIKGKEA